MPVGYYKELAILGFVHAKHGKGSHEKWRNPNTGVSVTVPYSLDSRHTANMILKQAGGSKKF